ncbi:MAG: hypothetical protein IPJ34_36105 [Myxococcales bacterium]|nr:hypothetical protein [Myxococcales bacterium]
MNVRALALALFPTLFSSLAACSSDAVAPPALYAVRLDLSSARPFGPDKRLPISFEASTPETFTVDLALTDLSGAVRTSFNGWVRLSLEPGGVVFGTTAPPGVPVSGPNVKLTAGVAKGVTVKVIGAYGDTRLVAEDVGFAPTTPDKVAACANGVDDDGNGFADFPNDPNCLFLNDDDETPATHARGVSQPLNFAFPLIHDVQQGASTPYLARQVSLVGDAPAYDGKVHRIVVHGLTSNGMYVTDIDDLARGSASIFVFNFSVPFGVRPCDTLTRLSGNVAEFFGGVQLGTPGWTTVPWFNEKTSGACPIPDFAVIDGTKSGIAAEMDKLESALVTIKNPVIGRHFGSAKAPAGVPADDASNCDLDGDGIVGFNAKKGGFKADEKACNDACTADPDCTEWNNFKQFGQAKIKFAPGDGVLFFQPTAVPGFDMLSRLGPGKFAELRGVITKFLGPTPPYTVEPRCADDIIEVGAPPSTIKTAQTACVSRRVGIDIEGTN